MSQREEDFEQTVRAFSAELYRYAYWLCRERGLAEDLVQEAFSRAWVGWAGLRETRALKAWLMTILRNEHARTFARKRPEIDESADAALLPSLASFESRIELEDLLRRLPEGYREPLVLQCLGGFAAAEIAAILGTTEGAVMTRLTRARQALREVGRDGAATARKAVR